MIKQLAFFFVMALLGNHPLHAQEYLPTAVESAHWRIHVDNLETLWQDEIYGYVNMWDTVINDMVYQKVYKWTFLRDDFNQTYPYPFIVTGQTLKGVIRDDPEARKVYAIKFVEDPNDAQCPTGTEYVLFDFSKEPGDTLELCGLVDSSAVVTGVGSEFIWGEERKRMETSAGWFYEGLGSESGLFEMVGANLSGWNISLLHYCLRSFSNCGILGTPKTYDLRYRDFRIFPNPAGSELTLDLTGLPLEDFDILIYSGQGKEVYKAEKISREWNINLNNWKSGVYLILLRQGSRIIGMQRFVVLR